MIQARSSFSVQVKDSWWDKSLLEKNVKTNCDQRRPKEICFDQAAHRSASGNHPLPDKHQILVDQYEIRKHGKTALFQVS